MIISLSRIFTKLLIADERRNTLIFFLVSISMEMLCFLLHLLVRRSRFVRYYTSHAQGQGPRRGHDPRDNGTGYRVHHDVTAEEVRFVSSLTLRCGGAVSGAVVCILIVIIIHHVSSLGVSELSESGDSPPFVLSRALIRRSSPG